MRGIAEVDGTARIALVGATLAEARAVMVEGERGVLAIAPDDRRPLWEPSLRRLSWPSGAIATLYSASEPEGLRGPQHSHGWYDEIAKWAHGMATWSNLALGMRLGERPRIVATTTPRPVPRVRALVGRHDVVMTGGRSADNRANLADYGNRIPPLSFEVEADPAPVALATIAATLSDGDIVGTSGPLLTVYAAQGNSLRGAIEGLAGALPVAFGDGSEGVVLVDETLAPVSIGGTVRTAASGAGDAAPAEAQCLFQACALRPPAPAARQVVAQADGSLAISWVPRSRAGWSWLDSIDAPLGEEAERYRLSAARSIGTALVRDVDTPGVTLAAADLVALGEEPLQLSVARIGTAAASLPPATLTVTMGD